MNTTLKSAVLSLLGIVGPLLAQASTALDAASAGDSNALETIIVTAQKRAEPLKEVPLSITALSGSTLDKLEARDFADYALRVPGFSLTSSQAGLSRLTLRGQNAGGVGSTVAVYIDESPFGSSSALLNGSILSGDFDTWDLQRVEVLRGPQGTLYGSNSEGGLLKFVTTAPQLGTFSGAAEVTGEGVDHGAKGGDVHGMVNLPLGDLAAFRISAYDQGVAGYIDDPTSGKTDLNVGHKYGGRASFLIEPVENLIIRLTASEQEAKYSGTGVVDVDPITLQTAHGDLTQNRFLSEPSSFHYENSTINVDWNVGPFSVISNTSYGALNSDIVSDFTSTVLIPPTTTLGEFLGAVIAPGLGGYLDDSVDVRKFTQELRLASPAAEFIEWQAGIYYTRELGELLEHLNAVSLPSSADAGLPSLEVPEIDSVYKEYAGYGNVTVHIIPQFDIQGGGRYSHNSQTATETVTGLLVSPQAFTTPSSGSVVTYSVAPRFLIDDSNMLYARVASGYRPGGPNALPPSAPPNVEREYGADKTTNYEIGFRSTQLNGLFSIDVAAFYVDWKNIQLLELVNGYGINGNGGKAKSQGFEWTFQYVPVTGLNLSWTGAYTDAKLTTDAPAVNGVRGDKLPYAPKVGTTVDGEYDFPVFADYKGFVGASYSYVSSRESDFASSSGATGVMQSQVELPSYSSVGARVGIENRRYRVMLYAKNLNDSRGITYFVGTGAPGLQGEATVIQPRTVGVTLSAKF